MNKNSTEEEMQKMSKYSRLNINPTVEVETPSSTRGRGRGRGRGKPMINKATIKCYKCHNLGHYQYECSKWKKEENYVEDDYDDELLLMAQIEEMQQTEKKNGVWFIDSGCSNHMCNDAEMFATLDKSFLHSVKLGNNSKMEVSGKENVKILFDGLTYVITDVYLISELKNNFLSVGQLQEKGVCWTTCPYDWTKCPYTLF
ncbi:hypothetical protein LIER_32286 [Lithospermum erythrorhizon]|uniref:CCHC-type domain-containing protein n=1 Tax=Lithospermum erythrorhizon TaxID=34254 RepID=A0AAV3RTG8_LITER